MKLRLGKILPWRQALPMVGGSAVSAGLLMYRLASLAPRLSSSERTTLSSADSIMPILTNPIHLLPKLMLFASQFLPKSWELWSARVPSVMLALVALWLFTYLAHRWYGRRTAIFGFFLFVSAAWFLHVGRFGGVDIEYLTAILALMAVNVSLHINEERTDILYLWTITNVILLTVPGMVWFVLLSAIWQWRAVWHALQHTTLIHRLITLGIFAVSAGALASALMLQPLLVWSWLGVPANITQTVGQLPLTFARTLLTFGFSGPSRPEMWLGQLPILDFFVFAMFLAGLFFYMRHWRAGRTHMLISYLLLGSVLAAFDAAHLSLIVPVLYLIAVGGIAYFLHYWMRVFPRNPLARALGIGVIATLIAVSCSYNLVQYFIAWPHNTQTMQIYATTK